MHIIPLDRISYVFRGKAAETNKEILKILALHGPMSIYELWKNFFRKEGIDYSVINRRIRSLTADGLRKNMRQSIISLYPKNEVEETLQSIRPEDAYVIKVGEQKAEKTGQKIPIYGLTLKGAILSLFLVDYDSQENLVKILESHADYIPIYKITLRLIKENIFDLTIVKKLFLDSLKEMIKEGLNIDLFDDYKLLRFASIVIRHKMNDFKDLVKEPEKDKWERLWHAISQLKKLSHPKSVTKWFETYLKELK